MIIEFDSKYIHVLIQIYNDQRRISREDVLLNSINYKCVVIRDITRDLLYVMENHYIQILYRYIQYHIKIYHRYINGLHRSMKR